ncbi:hypothetical protein CGZ94_04965 [Enemella evansiae]|uniref:Uncharacterized protein n=1 Tax=Enemella evansiae TaxID=2016499 RepID=A0A255GTB7_9ACTN|nr:hypothetical protein [Enemella evansiae]OYO16294.1 hypothetical protein CGZ94_04965 [Enemella evansiae]
MTATILGSIFTAIVTGLFGYLIARLGRRSESVMDSVEWERKYRAAAEAHIAWDFEVRALLQQAGAEIDQLRAQAGEPPRQRKPLPPPPPLFPKE